MYGDGDGHRILCKIYATINTKLGSIINNTKNGTVNAYYHLRS